MAVVTVSSKNKQTSGWLTPQTKVSPSPIKEGPLDRLLINPKINEYVNRYARFHAEERISYWIKRVSMESGDSEAITRASWLGDKTVLSCLSSSKEKIKYSVQIADKLGLMALYLDDQAGLASTTMCLRSLKGKPKLAKTFVDWASDIAVNSRNSAILQMTLANVSKFDPEESVIPLSWYSQLSANLRGRDLAMTEALSYLSKLDKKLAGEVLLVLVNISATGNGNKQARDLSARLVSDATSVLSTSENVTLDAVVEFRKSRFWAYPESLAYLKHGSSLDEKVKRLNLYVYLRDYGLNINAPSTGKKWLKSAEALKERADKLREEKIQKARKEEERLKTEDYHGQLYLQF